MCTVMNSKELPERLGMIEAIIPRAAAAVFKTSAVCRLICGNAAAAGTSPAILRRELDRLHGGGIAGGSSTAAAGSMSIPCSAYQPRTSAERRRGGAVIIVKPPVTESKRLSKTKVFVRYAECLKQADDGEVPRLDYGARFYLPHGSHGHSGLGGELLLGQAHLLADLP